MDILNKNDYHFIGIGGIGISAIAKMLSLKGKQISGSDIGESEVIDDLEKSGIKIYPKQEKGNITDNIDVVIYTIAITENNPELIEAKNKNIPCFTYPQILGILSKEMKTIAISGTHGKTTTTAMIGHIFKKANLDPTIIVGSKMINEKTKEYTNFIAGKSNILIVEACEYKKSFLNLNPYVLAITNIEADHLDYYKDIEDIKNAFGEMINQIDGDGFIVANTEAENIKDILKNQNIEIIDYSKININEKICVIGRHNIENAKTAIAVAKIFGIEEVVAINYLKSFRGTWRRLEYKGEKANYIVYDDYAHHPTEITASLSTLKDEYPNKKILCVFEAHQQSRTKHFFDEFTKALSIADYVFLPPIFITREINDKETTNYKLAKNIGEKAKTIENIENLKTELNKLKNEDLCIVMMGAGNIYKWTKEII